MRIPIAALLLLAPAAAPAQESYLGNLAPVLRSMHEERGFPLEYARRGKLPLAEWRKRGRAEVERTLSYSPKRVPLDMQVHARIPRRGYELRVISFAASPHYRIPAFLLVPSEGKPPFPAVVALHDHGGYFYHGKEKVVEIDPEPAALTAFKQQYYGGRSYASELARRGFVVLAIDAFYWGERRLQYRQPPKNYPADAGDIAAVNRFLRERVYELNTWMSFCGTSWMGVVSYDDRRSVDLLASLPEADPKRLGCVGLSVGGYRATYLAGLDSRVRAAVIVGWMTSLPATLDIPFSVHAGLPDAFGLHASLDHPDIATLAAPDTAVFVQNCGQDRLFTHAGMESAAQKIRGVYADLKRPERFQSRFYDVPHQFNAAMQEDAFAWLDKWLK